MLLGIRSLIGCLPWSNEYIVTLHPFLLNRYTILDFASIPNPDAKVYIYIFSQDAVLSNDSILTDALTQTLVPAQSKHYPPRGCWMEEDIVCHRVAGQLQGPQSFEEGSCWCFEEVMQ